MSIAASADRPTAATVKRRSPKVTGGLNLGKDASREAKRKAAAVLEVLAGLRTPAQAATALEMSQIGYYLLERRALEGLLKACEPRPKGRQQRNNDLLRLRAENERLQRDLNRQQALARLAQRTVGLTAPAPTPAKPGKKSRKRRPVARALSVATRLQQDLAPGPVVTPAGMPATVS
jgi:hypothetical protein